MYCPICGQQQASEITRFCSRCGFLLTGVAQVIANNGNLPFAPPSNVKLVSPRRRGVMQGLFIFLLGTFLIVPIVAIVSAAFNFEPFIVAILAILSFCGGILRILYALFFEDSGRATVPNTLLPEAAQSFVSSALNRSAPAQQNALPPQPANFNSINAAVYTPPASQSSSVPARGSWRDSNTNELMMPPSVTEDTTKRLEQQEPKS